MSQSTKRTRRAPSGTRLPTVLDVARLAGVSKTTVSDVIREQGSVATATRARVFAAIEQIGYRPNIAARSLKLQRTEVLGVVAGDFFDPFNAELTAHLESEAAARGLKILLATSGEGRDAEVGGVRSLLEHRVAALIFVGFSGQHVTDLIAGTPSVFISTRSPLGPSITLDDRKAGALATTHLVELGHRRIAYVSTTFGAQPDIDRARLDGYRRALRRGGLTPDKALELRLGGEDDAARDAALRGLLRGRGRPTAVFAGSDITAIEVMGCADALGLQVPGDLSIVGIDNISLTALPRISLTTVAQPIVEIARRAIATATEAPANGGDGFEVQVIAPELIVRRSTAPPS